MRSRRSAVMAGVVTWAVVLAGLRVSVALPEACPPVTDAELVAAIDATVAWFAAAQDPDGSFAYRITADGERLGGYSEVRHAGVLLSLYQAAAGTGDRAFAVAERGLGWAREQLRSHDDWIALEGDGARLTTGASALLLAALLARGEVDGTGAHTDPALVEGLGRFLGGQVEPSGAVLAYWEGGAPVPGTYSPFFTGEAFWALARLHAVDPDSGAGPPALRIGRYLATARDRAESRVPPVHDHWAAYGLDEVLRGWEAAGAGGSVSAVAVGELTGYAGRLGGYLATAARFQSKDGPAAIERAVGGPPRGAARGTAGEGLAALWRLSRAGTLTARTGELAGHVRCTAGLLVRDQDGGAWFWRGETRMDDQQHALSALLAAREVVRDE